MHSDSAEGIQRLNQEAAKAMAVAGRAGIDIPPERAIRWLTEHPAKALGIANQTGTLAPGKMGDVVVWNGTPFSVYARAEKVFVDGALLYDRNDPSRQPKSDFMLGRRRRHEPSHRSLRPLLALVLGLSAGAAGAQDVLIQHATVHTAGTRGTLKNADVLVQGGIIRAVGPNLPAPAGVKTVDAQGRPLTPGLFGGIGGHRPGGSLR